MKHAEISSFPHAIDEQAALTMVAGRPRPIL